MNDTRRLRAMLLAALADAGAMGCASTVSSTGADTGTAVTPDTGSASVDVGTPPRDTGTALDRGTPATDTGIALDRGTPAMDAGTQTRPPPPTCTGGRSEFTCYTLQELERMIRNPAMGGGGGQPDSGNAPIDASVATNGCYEQQHVLNGCCIGASGPPWREAERCCYWFCAGACCGRPFAPDGRARVAELRNAGPEKSAIATAWRSDGLQEHASVAAFARFTLQLMSVGAPADLVGDSVRAGIDEIAHARGCFEVATRYDGRSPEPGPLDVTGALGPTTLGQMVREVAREGCVGETLAARVAAEQAAVATDPRTKEFLEGVARDEGRHAELAWRFVAWALKSGDPALRRTAGEVFAECLAAPREVADAPVDGAEWNAAGLLLPAQRARVETEALREVVGPCARALLEG